MDAVKLGAMAINALTRALAATVKPGLTDMKDSGAQKNKDYFTMLRGINAISPWLLETAHLSVESVDLSPTILFSSIRKLGVKAECDMLRATGGINTHKGSLFCMLIAVASAGRAVSSKLWPSSDTVCILAQEMAQDECQRELDTLNVKIKLIGEKSLSAGERVYMKYKLAGARGEAGSGFQTVRKHALPVFRKLSADKSISLNDIYVQAFMTLMAHTPDTGICAKESDFALEEVQDRANGILERGGILTPIGREKIEKLNEHMNARGLCPSASGALLGTAIFLGMLDDEPVKKL